MNIIILLFIVILFVLLGFFVETNKEHFLTLEKKNGEYYCEDEVKCPVRGLDQFCRDKGLEPAYMPQTCFKKDGTFDYYKNCICQDKDGFCEICYPHSEKLAGEELEEDLINTIPVESDNVASVYTSSVET